MYSTIGSINQTRGGLLLWSKELRNIYQVDRESERKEREEEDGFRFLSRSGRQFEFLGYFPHGKIKHLADHWHWKTNVPFCLW